MYVKLDPKDKAENPYGDIAVKNQSLFTSLMWSNIWGDGGNDPVFACAPPEWVPLWEWIPAVTCWLGNMLPPTISLSGWTCGPELLSDNEREELVLCNGDVNKNGINDCIESKLENGTIDLVSDSQVYYYGKSGTLVAKIKDAKGNIVTLDSTNRYFFWSSWN